MRVFSKLAIVTLLVVAPGVFANYDDVLVLQDKVNATASEIYKQTGQYPTPEQLQFIKMGYIRHEISNSSLSVSGAVDKYQLSSNEAFSLNLTIKTEQDAQASLVNGGNGDGDDPKGG